MAGGGSNIKLSGRGTKNSVGRIVADESAYHEWDEESRSGSADTSP